MFTLAAAANLPIPFTTQITPAGEYPQIFVTNTDVDKPVLFLYAEHPDRAKRVEETEPLFSLNIAQGLNEVEETFWTGETIKELEIRLTQEKN